MTKLIKVAFVTAILTLALAGVGYAITTTASQIGNAANNTLNGTTAADYQAGLAGNDDLLGRAQADSQEGGPGNDDIRGNGGDDVITPGDDRDIVDAGGGNDTIQARDRQRDVLFCGPGEDEAFVDDNDLVADDCETLYPEDVTVAAPRPL